MKVLFCPLASHGFVYPAIAVAQALRRRGHTAAFATSPVFQTTLDHAEFDRIPRGASDGPSFQVERWFYPNDIAMQVKHIEYAIERLAPDVIVGNPLSLGPVLVRERVGVPLAVLGLAVHLWPVRETSAMAPSESEADRRCTERHAETMRHYNDARLLFRLPPRVVGYGESPLLGDLFMLQSIPELGIDIERFPDHAHLVGSCLWEPAPTDELNAWIREVVAAGQPLVYVHHGRSFGHPSFWQSAMKALGDQPLRVAAAVGRMDRATSSPPAAWLVRDHLCQAAVLAHARLVICGGNSTAVLGALTHGLPSLMVPGGAEQPDAAELVARAGAAIVVPVADANEEAIGCAVETLLHQPECARRATAIGWAFARWDGPERAALLIEQLARTKSPVTRRSTGHLVGDVCP